MSGIVIEPVNVAFESAVQRIVDRKRKDESAVDFMQRVVAIRRALCTGCAHWKHEHKRPYGCSRCACRGGYGSEDDPRTDDGEFGDGCETPGTPERCDPVVGLPPVIVEEPAEESVGPAPDAVEDHLELNPSTEETP